MNRVVLLGFACLLGATGAGCSQRANLIESGRVEREMFRQYPLRGHVDVELVGSDGTVLERKDAPVSLSPCRKHRPFGAFFHIYLTGQMPEDGTVRVTYHAVTSHSSV